MFAIMIITETSEKEFQIHEENETAVIFYINFLSIFSIVDSEKKEMKMHLFHKMSDEYKSSIDELVTIYEKFNIKLRQLSAFFRSLPLNEYFFISPKQDLSLEQNIYIHEYLKLLNSGENIKNIPGILRNTLDKYHGLFSEVLKDYKILHFEPTTKTFFGENDKSKRICRFCGGSESTGKTFKKIAHTISESLGNKKIISNEECDECNSTFANTIEEDAFDFLKIFRVMYGMKGKDGIPTLKFKNGTEIRHENGHCCIFEIDNGKEINPEELSIPMHYYRPINFMNIYRAFVKYAIGLIDRDDLTKFTNTISWINNVKNDGSSLDLPKLACHIDKLNYYEQPIITLYRRKTENYDYPFMYVELKIAMYIFVFIIPFSDLDKTDFSTENNYIKFWQINSHYNSVKDWTFYNFNIDKAKEFTYNINFTNKKE